MHFENYFIKVSQSRYLIVKLMKTLIKNKFQTRDLFGKDKRFLHVVLAFLHLRHDNLIRKKQKNCLCPEVTGAILIY